MHAILQTCRLKDNPVTTGFGALGVEAHLLIGHDVPDAIAGQQKEAVSRRQLHAPHVRLQGRGVHNQPKLGGWLGAEIVQDRVRLYASKSDQQTMLNTVKTLSHTQLHTCAVMICFSGEISLLLLYRRSPMARDRFRFPFTLVTPPTCMHTVQTQNQREIWEVVLFVTLLPSNSRPSVGRCCWSMSVPAALSCARTIATTETARSTVAKP